MHNTCTLYRSTTDLPASLVPEPFWNIRFARPTEDTASQRNPTVPEWFTSATEEPTCTAGRESQLWERICRLEWANSTSRSAGSLDKVKIARLTRPRRHIFGGTSSGRFQMCSPFFRIKGGGGLPVAERLVVDLFVKHLQVRRSWRTEE